MRRYLAAALLALLLLLGLAGSASAHAVLERADPPQGTALHAPPRKIILGFDEGVEPAFSKIDLYDREGRRLPTGPVQSTPGDDTEIFAVPPAGLNNGVYTVVWQVVSVDGHLVKGAYPFSIGEFSGDPGNPALFAARTLLPPLPPVVLHWLQFVAALLATGAAAFGLLVLPALAEGEPRRALAGRTAALAAWGGAGLIAAYLLILPAQAAQVSDLPLWQALSPALLGRVATTSNWGRTWVAGLPLAALQYALLRFAGRHRAGLAAAAATGSLVLLTLALSGHAVAVRDNAWLAVGADWVHLIAAAVWLGGLPLMLLTIRPLTAETTALWRLVRRFSAVAAASVALILLTGLYQALLEVPAWAALVATAYGVTLMVKLALVLLLLALGAYNLLAAGPRLQRSTAAARDLGRAVRGELLLAVGVLGAAAVLTALPPARVAYTKPYMAAATAADLRVQLAIDPARAGYNQFDVLVTDAAGRPVADALRVRLQFTMLSHEMTPLSRDLSGAGNGHYRGFGSELSMAGDWRLIVQVRRRGVDDVTAAFPVAVSYLQ